MKKEENTEDEFLKDLYPDLFETRIALDSEPPEGYFENLSNTVMDKIRAIPEKEKKSSARIVQFINVRNMAIAAAAAIFLAFVPYIKSVFNTPANPIQTSFNQIIEETDLTDFDTYADEDDLYDMLAAEGIYTLLNTESLTDDEIIEYLIHEGYDEDLILENS